MINPETFPPSEEKELVWERCLSLQGLHAKVPKYKKIIINYYTPEKRIIKHQANSSWSALLKHECDHLEVTLYPMRMNDLSLFSFNDEPGDLDKDILTNKNVDPLFKDLVKKWPAKMKWGL